MVRASGDSSAGPRVRLRIGLEQNDVRRFLGNITGEANRDSEVGLGQGRGVIDAISNKSNLAARGLNILDYIDLTFGTNSGENVTPPESQTRPIR